MDKRLVAFLGLSIIVLMGSQLLMQVLYPPKPKKVAQAELDQKGEKKADPQKGEGDPKKDPDADPAKKPPEKGDAEKDPEKKDPEKDPAAQKQVEIPSEPAPQWITLGSVDESSPYRMLVTLTNAGAAVERIELAKYRDLEKDWGYLGAQPSPDVPNAKAEGCLIRTVGAGTPAGIAGLLPGDILTAINEDATPHPGRLDQALRQTRPKQTVELHLQRGGQPMALRATLTRHPLEIIRPEGLRNNPPSLRVSLEKLDKLVREVNGPEIDLPGAELETRRWELVSPKPDENAGKVVAEVVYKAQLPHGLEIYKRYQLTPIAEAQAAKPADAAEKPLAAQPGVPMPAQSGFDLSFEIEIRNPADNVDPKPHVVAYRLDGPNGLPTEGWWYASKVSGTGIRDFVQQFYTAEGSIDGSHKVVSAVEIADDKLPNPEYNTPVFAVGVDAQYFSTFLFPQSGPDNLWYGRIAALAVDPPDAKHKNLTNTSLRLTSIDFSIKPGKSLVHRLVLFAGPKDPEILRSHHLDYLINYGWFSAVAVVMTGILHFFYGLVGNYGLAIILLTVFVRTCLFPFSRKQAISAERMKAIQPEMEKIKLQYKNKDEAARAQMELFRKHNVNPFGGCGMLVLQLPIFIGLYKGLQADFALRDAPLFGENFWASNLAAPDMLFKWEGWFPWFVSTDGLLGPYFNLLPIITIGLYLAQNKMLMPPPQNEQQEIQQKTMNMMMFVMGFMFFKVAAGLCVYFIASSLWSLGERKLVAKLAPAAAAATSAASPAAAAAEASGAGSGSASAGGGGGGRRKKSRK